MKRIPAVLIGVLALGIILAVVSWSKSRSSDVAEIRADYENFRNALMAGNFEKAWLYVDSTYRKSHKPGPPLFTFESVTSASGELKPNTQVEFWSEIAILYPQGPSGAIGFEFIKETNKWKITGNLIPRVH